MKVKEKNRKKRSPLTIKEARKYSETGRFQSSWTVVVVP
jgi:hypothetical protein